MVLLASVRRSAYWALDALRGGMVKKAYMDIKKIDGMDSDAPFIQEYRRRAWKRLKEQSVKNTIFYHQYRGMRFAQFPVISKNDIRSNQEAFLSAAYKKEDLVRMATSGSTGTPFECYQNRLKKKRVNAEIIYYSEKAGYHLGENLSYIRTIVKQNKKSGFRQFLQNQTLLNCSELGDRGIEKLLHGIQEESRRDNVTLLAYGSTYKAIADYAKRHGITCFERCRVTGAISGSDMLFDGVRDSICKLFGGIPVVSRYSNEENGVLGQDEDNNNVFPVNEADYIVEVLDGAGNTLPDGKLGRIVVTDLFNYAMPMIRYDTGDMGALRTVEMKGRKKKCICDFSGRKVDVLFNAEGEAISPHAVTNHMWAFPDILQFQFIQKDKKEYLLKLNVPEGYKRIPEILDVLYTLLGDGAKIAVEMVDEIPVLSSGKRRYIVNEIYDRAKTYQGGGRTFT